MPAHRFAHAHCLSFALVFIVLTGSAGAQVASPCAGPSFAPTPSPNVPLSPTSVATGDFNLDGIPDLAVTSEGTFQNQLTTVSVLLGFGSGGFAPPVQFAAGQRPRSVAVDDLDLDGNPDLAVANMNSSDVSVLLGDGAGGFAAAMSFPTGFAPRSITIGDFNSDGLPDLATADSGVQAAQGTTVSVLLGDGLGGFGPPIPSTTGTAPFTVVASDFNNDGSLDLATANFGSGDVTVLLGDGTGAFAAPSIVLSGVVTAHVAVGDLDQDGNPDLAVPNTGTVLAPGSSVSVLMGDGLGGFAPSFSARTGLGPLIALIDDFDLDGRPDLATTHDATGGVSVMSGDGLGGFAPAVNYGAGTAPYSAAVDDFDQDGSPDLATANYQSDNVTVLMNSCTRLRLSIEQTGGPGSPVLVRNFHMTPGSEYYNIVSFYPCTSAVGSGPYLGLCASTPAAAQTLIDQLLLPLGAAPFHFVATAASMSFGPFPVPPLALEGVCFEITGGTLGPVSGVSRIFVR